ENEAAIAGSNAPSKLAQVTVSSDHGTRIWCTLMVAAPWLCWPSETVALWIAAPAGIELTSKRRSDSATRPGFVSPALIWPCLPWFLVGLSSRICASDTFPPEARRMSTHVGSHASPMPSPSLSRWDGLWTVGQLSTLPHTPSWSASLFGS